MPRAIIKPTRYCARETRAKKKKRKERETGACSTFPASARVTLFAWLTFLELSSFCLSCLVSAFASSFIDYVRFAKIFLLLIYSSIKKKKILQTILLLDQEFQKTAQCWNSITPGKPQNVFKSNHETTSIIFNYFLFARTTQIEFYVIDMFFKLLLVTKH